jgi:hypothetical protein
MDGSNVPKESLAPSLHTYIHDINRGGESTNTNTAKRTFDTTTNEEEIRALFDRWNDALVEGDPGAIADLYYHDEGNNHQSSTFLLLLPTLSNEPRTNRASVEEYFVAFLKRKPIGRIVSGQILIGPDGSWAHDAGLYEFVVQQKVPITSSLAADKTVSATNNKTNPKGEAARAPNDENTNHTDATAASVYGNDRFPKAQESKTSVVRARYSFLYLRDERGEWKIAHHHSSLMPEGD